MWADHVSDGVDADVVDERNVGENEVGVDEVVNTKGSQVGAGGGGRGWPGRLEG